MLEAARWSPSANNSQPWRFVVTHRGEAAFERLTSTLSGNNRRWAGRASALLLVLAETTDAEGRPRAYALYDTGQAVAHLVTQAQAEGLSTHQLGGFDKDAAAAEFGVDPRFTPVVVIAVGARQERHRATRGPRHPGGRAPGAAAAGRARPAGGTGPGSPPDGLSPHTAGMSGPVDAPAGRSLDAPAGPGLEIGDSRPSRVGQVPVRRSLPRRHRRTVGAWCFVDHYGPGRRRRATAACRSRPHPHTGLQTVTWLFDGRGRCTATASAASS